jgi:putative Holliday junction resolvase
LLGLDWGAQRVGVAISDDRLTLAVGYDIWPAREPELFLRLSAAVRAEHVTELIIGYPLTIRGEVGPQAQAVDAFIVRLESQGYTVHRWDERYTTSEASRSLSRLGLSQRKQRGRLDMSAAIILLQSYLDARASRAEPSS